MPLSIPQKTVADDTTRFRICVTGRRWGKTTLCLRELAKHATIPNSHCLYLAPNYRMSKFLAWEPLKIKLKQLRWTEQSNEAELTLRLKNQSKIFLKGAEAKESLRGGKYNFIILDEFQDMDPGVWDVLRPTLSDTKGRALFTGTPKGVGSWSYQMYTMAETTEDWSAHTFTTIEGGWVDQEEIEQAKRDLDEKTYLQEYEGRWNTYSGVVFHAFDRKVNVKPCAHMNTTEIWCGQDFNVDNMATAIFVIENKVMYCVDEILMRGSSTDDVVKEIKRRYPNSYINMFPDPSGKNRKTSAAGRTDISILQNAGFKVFAKPSHSPIRDGVNSVNSKLKNSQGVSTMFIDPKCKNVIKSLEGLVYKPETSVIDKDMGFDHFADAVRYICDYLFPITTKFQTKSVDRWGFKAQPGSMYARY